MALFKGDRAIRIAIEALKLLIVRDREKQPGEDGRDAYPVTDAAEIPEKEHSGSAKRARKK